MKISFKNMLCLFLFFVCIGSYLVSILVPVLLLKPYLKLILLALAVSGTLFIALLPGFVESCWKLEQTRRRLLYDFCSYSEYVEKVHKYLDNESIILLGDREEDFMKKTYYGWLHSALASPDVLIVEYLNDALPRFLKSDKKDRGGIL